jgi:hypothetical protein
MEGEVDGGMAAEYECDFCGSEIGVESVETITGGERRAGHYCGLCRSIVPHSQLQYPHRDWGTVELALLVVKSVRRLEELWKAK